MNLMEQAQQEAREYGYGITAEGRITRDATPNREIRAVVGVKGERLQVRVQTTGALLWSGARIGDFLEAFWFAEKKKATDSQTVGA